MNTWHFKGSASRRGKGGEEGQEWLASVGGRTERVLALRQYTAEAKSTATLRYCRVR